MKAKAELVAHGSSDRAPESLDDETSDRRRFLVRAGKMTAATMALVWIPGVARADKVKVYKLNPGVNCFTQGAGGPVPVDCTACKACGRHAKYKIFATNSAADLGRAHPGCDCQIVQKTMRGACFKSLFGPKGDLKRTSVDKRRPWVARVLRECS